ncbi:MAG: isoleucine--tRNA ligase [Candidatus Firestonebacteria bacterium]|nr:isoleucine--tRNA ligase [Candidatus Firestonebacteria bacterium]
MDYRETLNLPKTDFPMKADLTTREPQRQAHWLKLGLYELLHAHGRGRKKYVLHDGPPYANGDVHMGTALNKISKDLVMRYKSMRGFSTPYVPGWDCHGMPIEHKVVEGLPTAEKQDRMRIRQECRKYAAKFVDKQREQFKQLGILGDWEHPYLTMSPEYQATIVRLFGELALKGFIYRGLKPVYWCTSCKSALAEAEVEYEEHTSPSITVRFELVGGWPEALGARPAGKIYVPIWTTTPWTLPANRAVSVHPDFSYALVESEGDYYLLAKELTEANFNQLGKPYRVAAETPGRNLEHLKLQHPFLPLEVPVVLGKHVTLEAGTGCVHTAPGHGQEDFVVGKEYGLEVFNPVGENGVFTSAFAEMQGEFVFKANPKIVALLKERGALLHVTELKHSYPHCWRHHVPIIFRATEQWFLNVNREGFREKVLGLIQNEVTWIPEASRNRIGSMVASRPDWCLSRQRSWGVPLPIFYCRQCGEPLISETVFKKVEELVRAKNADVWFTPEAQSVLSSDTVCAKCGGHEFRQETDILDVWFDSGASHAAVLGLRPELKFPADMYLEGSDQHRGWFQVSLLLSAATLGQAPYRTVLTHGYTVDGNGRKMSKSLGNFITAAEGIKRYGGADILRLWVCSENVQLDVRSSDEIFKRTVDAYRRMRNTLRFLLSNLDGFHPVQAVPVRDLTDMDRLILHKLSILVGESVTACDAFDFYRFFQALHNFCSVDLSAFYFDVLKDRLYADTVKSASRLAAQTTLWHVLSHLVRLLAPVLVHTADEAWEFMGQQGLRDEKDPAESVHLATWLTPPKEWTDETLAVSWERLFEIRAEVQKHLEEARAAKVIGHSYEAEVTIRARGDKRTFLGEHARDLAAFFIVSGVQLGDAASAGADLQIKVEASAAKKCERCWRVLPSVGAHADHPTLCTRCHEAVTPAPKAGK